MRTWIAVVVSALLAACASVSPPPAPSDSRGEHLFHNELFAAPSQRISAEDVFALSDEMRQYLGSDIAALQRTFKPQAALLKALYDKGRLRLDYDAEMTRTAAQTFAARAGNCLSLAIMTAAFAKEMGVPVRYQRILVDDAWSRSGELYFASSHVNLTLGGSQYGRVLDYADSWTTVDFLPPGETRGRRLRVISEETIVAMFMNNRAAESLARGSLDDAYWFARAAIGSDPKFLSSYNTLGVIYRHHHNLAQAETTLRYVLDIEPANTEAMSNLALVLNDEGRRAEAAALMARLKELEPYPPFYFFNLGMAAMQEGDYRTARDMFAKELDRDAYYHEFHFWIAAAYLGLGDIAQARSHLATAMENSATRKEHALYAAKLDKLSAVRSQ
ncbi:MAG TPA: tetratricopeptide repeat protein [Casimicrobiaceae bacterium]|nr:tetratricopeptide repeat protein [Casimicrobiaceae bacterium]